MTQITKPHRLPHTLQDLMGCPKLNGLRVVEFEPGIVCKFNARSQVVIAEEVRALRFAAKLGLPVPNIIHHPPLPRREPSPQARSASIPKGVWYILTERCPGVALDTVIETFSCQELDHLATQLSEFLRIMTTVKPKTLGSVSGGPFKNVYFPPDILPAKYPFANVSEFIDYYRRLFELVFTPEHTTSLLRQLPRTGRIHFAHVDLIPRNIIVQGSTITAIVDWAEAGFYPEYWGYARMHHPDFVTPAWDYVLHQVFPGSRREAEIEGVFMLCGTLSSFFY